MHSQGTRQKVYLALFLGVGCYFSPFGWGTFCVNFPIVNLLLSLCFYLLVGRVGLETLSNWQPESGYLKTLMWGITTFSLGLLGWFGGTSFWMQQTSMHYQDLVHRKLLVYVLCLLAVFAAQSVWLTRRGDAGYSGEERS